jgi:hypothetical protein
MGSASVSGSNLNPHVGVADVAVPPLSDVSEDKDEDDDDDDSLEMIIGNLLPQGSGVEEGGRRKAVGKTMILIFPTPMTPTACLTLKLISICSLSVCVITWMVTISATRTESVLSGPFFSRWVLLCAIWTQ